MTDARHAFYRWLGRKFAAAGVLACAIVAFLFAGFIHAWSAGTAVEYVMIAACYLLAILLLGCGAWLWNRA